MTEPRRRPQCEATVTVTNGHYCDEPETLQCDLDAGHDDPNNAIGSMPVEPFHKWTDEPYIVRPGGIREQLPNRLTTTVTWITPPD